MEKKLNKNRFWTLLLILTALVFFVLGIVRIVDGRDYLQLSTSLINSFVFVFLAWMISRTKIDFELPNDGLKVFFPIGFVFAIAGSSGYLNAGVWGFGISLLVLGLFFSPKEKEELKEDQNAG